MTIATKTDNCKLENRIEDKSVTKHLVLKYQKPFKTTHCSGLKLNQIKHETHELEVIRKFPR